MRLNRYFLIAAMGLGLFACTDDLDNNGGQNGNKGDGQLADVSIKLDFRGSRTKAAGDLPTGEYDDGGTAEESKVNRLRVIVTDENGIVEYNQLYEGGEGGEGENKLPDGINGTGPTGTGDTTPWEGRGSIEFQIPTGLKTFYVYVNEEAATPDESAGEATDNARDLNIGIGQNFTVPTAKKQNASYFADKAKGFHMSGWVKQDITTVAAGSANEVTVNVDRVVAKVSLHLAATYDNDDSDNNKVTLASLTAGIGNADLTFKSETTGDNTLYGTYRFAYDDNNVRKTPYYSEVPTADKDNYENIIVRHNAGTGADDLLGKVNNAYPTHTYYCLENTHATYTKGNTTFVRIEAVMIPNEAVKFTYEAGSVNIEESDKEKPGTAETFYLITKVQDPAENAEGQFLNNYMWEDELENLFDTDGFLEDNEKGSVTDNSNTADKIRVIRTKLASLGYEFTEAYQDGKGYFYKAVNDMSDTNGKFTGKAPVFRNDWYDLTINSIKLPGSPSPDFGGEEPLHPDTDVEMTVTIRQWNKVDHTVDLE